MVRLENVSVSLARRPALHKVSWTLRPGEHWAVLGPNGAGKSTFLRLVRGELWPDQNNGGRRVYNFGHGEQESPISLRQRMGVVSARLQEQRLRMGWKLTGLEAVCTGFDDAPLLYAEPGPERIATAQEMLEITLAADLADTPLPAMSQGQLRRVLIARALAMLQKTPALLILDEACEGMDAAARSAVLAAADAAASRSVNVLCAAHREQDLPSCITHRLDLDKGRVVRSSPWIPPPNEPLLRLETDVCCDAPRSGKALPLVEITNADVFLDRFQALHAISWRIMSGDRWAVLGGNGAGKSTLLRLLLGDVAPALGGSVVRFGCARGDIRELRKRMGLVSAGLQARFSLDCPLSEVILSGFFGSVGLYDAVEEAMEKRALQAAAKCGVASLWDRPLGSLSTGQARRALLARALAPQPDILLLDEPCAGLDAGARNGFLETLQQWAQSGSTLVYVTHYADEIIPEIDRLLVLKKGRVVRQGKRSKA